MGIILTGVLGRFPLGTRQGTSLRGAGGNVCIHSPVWVHVSKEFSCLSGAGGRFWKAGEGHVQTQPGWTEGPADLTCEAGPLGWGAWTHQWNLALEPHLSVLIPLLEIF